MRSLRECDEGGGLGADPSGRSQNARFSTWAVRFDELDCGGASSKDTRAGLLHLRAPRTSRGRVSLFL